MGNEQSTLSEEDKETFQKQGYDDKDRWLKERRAREAESLSRRSRIDDTSPTKTASEPPLGASRDYPEPSSEPDNNRQSDPSSQPTEEPCHDIGIGQIDKTRKGESLQTDKLAPPLYKAVVREVAEQSDSEQPSLADIDEAIISRMRKCLEKANHPETSEHEAKAALFLASRLMKQYNVTQADVLSHEPPEERQKYAGQSTVSIVRRDGDPNKQVLHNVYIGDLCCAMKDFFEVKYYTSVQEARRSLNIIFYGIAENSAAAAYAFEMVYNLMVEWARPFKGLSGKNSYCLGVCDGLRSAAIKEREEEEARAKEKEESLREAKMREEELHRQAQLDRLHHQPVVEDVDELPDRPEGSVDRPIKLEPEDDDAMEICSDGSSVVGSNLGGNEYKDEDSGDDVLGETGLQADFGQELVDWTFSLDEAIEVLANAARARDTAHSNSTNTGEGIGIEKPVNETHSDEVEGTAGPSTQTLVECPWASHMQLMVFRKTASKIAEDYIKQKGMKFKKGRKRHANNIAKDIYKQGREDSKKIDVRRKTITY